MPALFVFPVSPDTLLEVLFVSVVALLLGSFTGALSFRAGRGLSWGALKGAQSRSRCPSCKTPLQARDLVPVLSWLAQRGKCRHCGAGVSPRYPVIELLSLALGLGIYGCYGFTVETALVMLGTAFFLALAAVDVERGGSALHLIVIAGALGLVFALWQLYAMFIEGATVQSVAGEMPQWFWAAPSHFERVLLFVFVLVCRYIQTGVLQKRAQEKRPPESGNLLELFSAIVVWTGLASWLIALILVARGTILAYELTVAGGKVSSGRAKDQGKRRLVLRYFPALLTGIWYICLCIQGVGVSE